MELEEGFSEGRIGASNPQKRKIEHSLEEDPSFGVLSRFASYSLYLYCTACCTGKKLARYLKLI